MLRRKQFASLLIVILGIVGAWMCLGARNNSEWQEGLLIKDA